MPHRRHFLRTSSLLGFGATVPGFLGSTAAAAAPLGTTGAKETVLVVVQLTGGNDGLNTVIPVNDADYAKLRPTIGVRKSKTFAVNDDLGLHPAFAAFGKLLKDDAAACVVQGVGYPNPDQSHFRSMDIWHAASTAADLHAGWLGKALTAKPAGAYHLAAANETAPLAFAGAPARVPSVASLADFALKPGGATAADTAARKTIIETPAGMSAARTPDLLDFVNRTAATTYESTARLAEVGKGYEPKVPYPATAFAGRLKLAAQLIDAAVGARVLYVSHDGFDTHAGQGGETGVHADLLKDVGDGIAAFVKDLAGRGHGDRVCVMTFSEFGRRAKENGSKGTDHGSAAPMFLAGGRVKPGVVGNHPSLTKTPDGNLVHHTDFRRVYAAVLKQWLGIDPKPIVGDFAPLDLFRA